MIQQWQAKQVRASIQPNLNYLNRLRTRMEKTGLHQEKLYELVSKAQRALLDVYIELHYLAAPGGVYREPAKSPSGPTFSGDAGPSRAADAKDSPELEA